MTEGRIGESRRVFEGALNLIPYSDTSYQYFCEALPGPECAKSSPQWRIMRKTIATGECVYAGDGTFSYQATNLGVVAALTYTMGA